MLLNNYIKTRRKELKMTQTEFGNYIKTSRTTVQKIEHLKCTVNDKALTRIALILETTREHLSLLKTKDMVKMAQKELKLI